MLSRKTSARDGARVLLASQDAVLVSDLQRAFHSFGLRFEAVTTADAVNAAFPGDNEEADDAGIVLLDARLPGAANGRLLAAMDDHGVHRRCAIAVIAEQVSEDWIARLREGVIDDIVPRHTDASGWKSHLHSMQRGHQLYRELEQLRETALLEVRHDQLTGLLNRETLLTQLFGETDRMQRLHSDLSLILFELDDVAHWEDTLGLAAANEIRREVARRAGRILRSYDLLGRTGENQFLLALPGCSTINAMMLAERLRMDLFGEAFPVHSSQRECARIKLTACFAVAASRGRSPIVVLREAEDTLALARLSGSGTLRCGSESPLPVESRTSVETARLFPEIALVSQ